MCWEFCPSIYWAKSRTARVISFVLLGARGWCRVNYVAFGQSSDVFVRDPRPLILPRSFFAKLSGKRIGLLLDCLSVTVRGSFETLEQLGVCCRGLLIQMVRELHQFLSRHALLRRCLRHGLVSVRVGLNFTTFNLLLHVAEL